MSHFPTTNNEWQYTWTAINLRVHAYVRYRIEPTFDGMGKPCTEIIAYLYDVGPSSGWEWIAYKNQDGKSIPMDLPPKQYFKAMLQVEEAFRKELTEG